MQYTLKIICRCIAKSYPSARSICCCCKARVGQDLQATTKCRAILNQMQQGDLVDIIGRVMSVGVGNPVKKPVRRHDVHMEQGV